MKRKRYTINLILYVLAISSAVIFGIIIAKYEIFPYKYIKSLYGHISTYESGPWSIGIYEGVNPFDIKPPDKIINPVLTRKNVTDIKTKFVADPFIVFNNKKFYMFFEAFNKDTSQGDIGYAESIDTYHWVYKRIIIDEPFHLSYPYVFKWNEEFYLIPESSRDLSVRLYKALLFPYKWKYIGNLLSGYAYKDPSILRYNNKWWLFVGGYLNSVLNLYYSDDLLTGWKPHPMNPIVKFDKKIARPGGRVIIYNSKIYRMAQDNEASYGIQVSPIEVYKLSEALYAEKKINNKAIVSFTNKGWNAAGMHHIDLLHIKDKWIAAVDGRDR